jgi:hypothetical protein
MPPRQPKSRQPAACPGRRGPGRAGAGVPCEGGADGQRRRSHVLPAPVRLAPKLRAPFKGDIKEQRRKLMALIKVAVNGLKDLDRLVPAVEALGQRHAAHGVKDGDYKTVG